MWLEYTWKHVRRISSAVAICNTHPITCFRSAECCVVGTVTTPPIWDLVALSGGSGSVPSSAHALIGHFALVCARRELDPIYSM